MNTAAAIKSTAYIAFALIALIKAMSMAKDKKKPDPVLQKDHRISGKVVKVMPEQEGYIFQVTRDGKLTWLMTEEHGLKAGDSITCDARKKFSAFESKQHQMAFETIFLVQNVTVERGDASDTGYTS